MEQARDPIVPHETLFVANRRRFVPAHVPKSGGPGELVLHCGFQQIIFDEPELFSWAERLIEQDSFLAGAATSWSAEPLQWTRVKDLLETWSRLAKGDWRLQLLKRSVRAPRGLVHLSPRYSPVSARRQSMR
jgi:hypothetical protein